MVVENLALLEQFEDYCCILWIILVPGVVHRLSKPDCSQHVVAIERTRMEPSLEEIPTPSLSEVDATRVPTMSFSDSQCETRFLIGNGNQVDVVRHQTPSQVANTESRALLGQKPEVGPPVIIREEDIQSSHAALDDMVGHPRDNDSSNAGHVLILS